jgi:hypothetical protein
MSTATQKKALPNVRKELLLFKHENQMHNNPWGAGHFCNTFLTQIQYGPVKQH